MVDLESEDQGRGENEVVVDPSFLGEIEQIENCGGQSLPAPVVGMGASSHGDDTEDF